MHAIATATRFRIPCCSFLTIVSPALESAHQSIGVPRTLNLSRLIGPFYAPDLPHFFRECPLRRIFVKNPVFTEDAAREDRSAEAIPESNDGCSPPDSTEHGDCTAALRPGTDSRHFGMHRNGR